MAPIVDSMYDVNQFWFTTNRMTTWSDDQILMLAFTTMNIFFNSHTMIIVYVCVIFITILDKKSEINLY